MAKSNDINLRSLNQQAEKNLEAFNSYYSSMEGFADSLLRRTGSVKQSFQELNDIIEEQKEKIEEVDESVDKLSKRYSAPKERISEIMKELKAYHELNEKIKNTSDGAYKNELIALQQIKEAQLERRALSKEILEDYKKGDTEIKGVCDKMVELSDSIDKAKEAQDKFNDSLEENIKKWDRWKKSGIAKIINGVKDAVFSLGKVGYEKFKEVDQAGHDFGRNMGMSTAELNKHTSSLFKNYSGLAFKLGMEFKDMYKFQTGYAESTQKAVMLTTDQVGTMAALSRNTGEEAVSVASKNLDVFATSADATIEYLAKGTARASLEGLNVKKYSEAFANNIKMASKYTFKEGITGIQKMTLLSQRLKFNMESIGSAMDKFSTLEGAIEASAKIQVLGGSFATNFGNPLEAMSQALLDGEGFTKRIIDTVSSQARFNSKTGEIDLSPIDKQRLKAYAEALGMSYEEVHNMATQTRKGKEIERTVGGRFSEEETAYLTNKAQFNKDKGIWELIDAEGKGYDISKLTDAQLESIRKTDTQEKILNGNVSEIKKAVQEIASKDTSFNENVTKLTEGTSLAIGGLVNSIYQLTGGLMPLISALGGLGLTGAIGAIGGGLFTSMRGNFSGGSLFGGIAKGGKFANGLKVASKFTKFAKIGGAPLALLTAGLGTYNAISNYSDEEQAILNSNLTASEKEDALIKAKANRNKGIGSSVGGGLGGWGGAIAGAKAGGMLGAFGGPVGAVIGAGIGMIAGGIGGYMLGNNIGESIGESVSDTVKEKKEKEGASDIKVEDIKVNVSGNVKLMADGTNGTIDISSLLKDNSFRKGIGDIVQEHIKKTVVGRTTES